MGRTSAELHLAGWAANMSKEDAEAILTIVDCLDNIVEVTDQAEIDALWVATDALGAPILLQSRAYGRMYAKREELEKWRASQSSGEGNAPARTP